MRLETLARIKLIMWTIVWSAVISILMFAFIAFVAICAILFTIVLLSYL